MKKRRSFMYLRLSSEDKAVSERMRDESNSIANQRALLRSYIQNHPDLGNDFEEIMDDGFSGTSFQRPGMKRLLSLVEADEVDVILACDAVALEQVVFQAIRNLIALADIEQERRHSERRQLQQRIGAVKCQIHSLSVKNRECNEEKLSLHEQLQSGQIDRETFMALKHEADQRLKLNRAEIEALTVQLSDLSAEVESVEAEQPLQLPALDAIDRLTPELLEAFVSRVVIHRGGEPEIVFRVKGLSGGQC